MFFLKSASDTREFVFWKELGKQCQLHSILSYRSGLATAYTNFMAYLLIAYSLFDHWATARWEPEMREDVRPQHPHNVCSADPSL